MTQTLYVHTDQNSWFEVHFIRLSFVS